MFYMLKMQFFKKMHERMEEKSSLDHQIELPSGDRETVLEKFYQLVILL